MPYRIVITSRSFGSTSPRPRQRLLDAGCEIVQPPPGFDASEANLLVLLRDADGWIIGTEQAPPRVLESLPRLRVLSRHGAGLDNIPLDTARARGIAVTNTPDANTESVAELAVGLLLALARRIPYADRRTREGIWKPVVGVELASKTLGIIGLGRIGQRVVRRMAGFEMQVLAFDLAQNAAFAAAHRVRYVPLDELLAASDVVSVHLPLVEGTRNLVGAAQFAQMKPSALFINTGRGELVDEAALVEALREKRIAGAALDVFAHEPPGADHPLYAFENVILTSHIGAHTDDAITAMSMTSVENLLAVLEGRATPYRVV